MAVVCNPMQMIRAHGGVCIPSNRFLDGFPDPSQFSAAKLTHYSTKPQRRTIKAIDGKSPPNADNEAITFGDNQVSSPKQIANYVNRQFTTSNLGRHTSSRETRLVSREITRKTLMSAVTFTTDQVIKGISNCSNTKAFGPDKLSILHLKNLGPRAIEYLTAFFNDSATSCRIPAIWKSSIVIPIPKPGKDSSLGTSYRPISLLCIKASETNIGKIQRAHNEALRIITGSYKMSSIDYIHRETKMLQVEDHLNFLSAQYLVRCLDTDNVWHHIT